MLERVPTGIKELDELLGGGLIKYSVTLLAGNPGTGKTTIASHFIYEGLKCGEPGIYVSFSESKRDYYKYMKVFGMNFEKYEEAGIFKFIEAPTISDPDMVDELISFLDKSIRVLGARRVVIDSITALTSLIDPVKTRAFLHTVLTRVLKSNKTTSIIIADIPFGREYVGYGVEEFIVDNVIITKIVTKKYYSIRVLSIRKMRGTTIETIEVPFTIVENKGIRLLPTKHVRESCKLINYVGKRLETGIQEIDQVLDGGIPKAAQILITGPAGSGKVDLALRLVKGIADRYKPRILIVSLNEPEYLMKHRVKKIGIDGPIKFAYLAPYISNPVDMVLRIYDLITTFDPEILMLYDLKVMFTTYEFDEAVSHITFLSSALRSKGKIGLYVHTALYPQERIPYDPIADIIFNIVIDVKEGRLVRRLFLWKNAYGRVVSHPLKIDVFSNHYDNMHH